MPKRYFTPEEANETLELVRPLVERMIEHRRALVEAQARQAQLTGRVAGNGANVQSSELAAGAEEIDREATGVARCIAQIHELGVLVKDLDRGLVDFPARQGREDVLLCWHLEEDEVAYWHGLEEGFGGRKPLPL